MPVILAPQEAEVGELLEPGRCEPVVEVSRDPALALQSGQEEQISVSKNKNKDFAKHLICSNKISFFKVVLSRDRIR